MKKRKDGRWERIKTINGKRVSFYSSEPTEKKAIKDIENQMLNYKEKQENGLTFKQVVDLWQQSPQYLKLSPTTQKRYDILLKHIKKFNNRYIKTITAEEIQDFLTELSNQDYATKTIKHQFSIFKIIFKFAKLKRYIKEDETQYVIMPEGQKAVKRRALTENEVKIIEKHADTEYGFFPYFLLNTGLRRGEALALQYGDIDRKNKIIHITKSAYYEGNQTKIKPPKTDAGTRDVIIPVRLLKKLPKGKKDDFLFHYPDEPSKLMTQRIYERKWKDFLTATGLNITAHMLRHTYATILFEADINVKDAQSLMGHADITTTNNIYTHIRENRITETAKKLNDFLDK